MLLRTLVAVIDRAEKRWVKARQPREILGVHFVVLVFCLCNQLDSPGMRHDYCKSHVFEQINIPFKTSAGFNHASNARILAPKFANDCFVIDNPFSMDEFAVLIAQVKQREGARIALVFVVELEDDEILVRRRIDGRNLARAVGAVKRVFDLKAGYA